MNCDFVTGDSRRHREINDISQVEILIFHHKESIFSLDVGPVGTNSNIIEVSDTQKRLLIIKRLEECEISDVFLAGLVVREVYTVHGIVNNSSIDEVLRRNGHGFDVAGLIDSLEGSDVISVLECEIYSGIQISDDKGSVQGPLGE